jgi:hypothetical protein
MDRGATEAHHSFVAQRTKPLPGAHGPLSGMGKSIVLSIPFEHCDPPYRAICIGRTQPDVFSEKEVRFFSLISDFVALAVDDRVARAKLESECTKLSLIIGLNNRTGCINASVR